MLDYLVEIRYRLIKIVSVFSCLFILFFLCSSYLFNALIQPLLKSLPQQSSVIATQITTPLFTPINLAADAAFLCVSPFILFHIWRFAAPGLYPRERKGLTLVIIMSMFLFILGCFFCYYLVLPYMFKLVVDMVPRGVNLMPDMTYSLNFITRMLVTFGLCFQIPLLSIFFVHLNIVSIETLRTIRPYVIVIAFVLGMLFTPPDVFSQVMLAIPLWLLYELGILLSKRFNF